MVDQPRGGGFFCFGNRVKPVYALFIVTEQESRKIAFFGCPLDSDERQEAVSEKYALAGQGAGRDDPYDHVLGFIRREIDPALWREEGSLPVPAWLRPIPPAAELEKIWVENFVQFIDGDGCRACAAALGDMAAQAVFPDIPCLITVDHSLTGGVLLKLAERLGPENISLVVLDSHLDAVPVPVMAGAIAYDMETNPNSLHDPNDPFLQNRPDSYNASSFLHHLVREGVILAENLYLMGISDFPPKKALRIKDPRIKTYTRLWTGLQARGARLVGKKDLVGGLAKIKAILGHIKTPYLYISMDMDLGARNALSGVRFQDWQGVSETQLYSLARVLRETIQRGVSLAGLDVCEFNHRKITLNDRTYRIAANLVEMICFGLDPKD